ncbi:hypothetical protein BpHYR1_052492 [Brachionus plicatilis]|uniref:Uncharacterized protein n=1 Tax=Brachionus plicatilis TaxID=10195 RepID=A0A3M7R8L2_BRAPC|nr:hypothetical protein BpHYR1_052492 [Brachionus plicatilis]
MYLTKSLEADFETYLIDLTGYRKESGWFLEELPEKMTWLHFSAGIFIFHLINHPSSFLRQEFIVKS